MIKKIANNALNIGNVRPQWKYAAQQLTRPSDSVPGSTGSTSLTPPLPSYILRVSKTKTVQSVLSFCQLPPPSGYQTRTKIQPSAKKRGLKVAGGFWLQRKYG